MSGGGQGPDPGARAPAIIFDLDGLLVDTEPIWAESARQLLGRRGRAYDPSLKPKIMGRHPLEVAGIMVRHYRLDERPEALLAERLELIADLYSARALRPMPGARRLVSALAGAGRAMAVASGSPRALMARALRGVGLHTLLTVRAGSDEVQRGKPAPDLFLLAARRLGAPPGRCIVLEDAAAGVEAARAAGMACVAVPSPETPPAAAARAQRVVASLEQLSLADLS